MTGMNGSGGCARTSWIVAAVVGAITFLLLLAGAGWGFFAALIAGLLLFAILGFLFSRFLCSDDDAVGTHSAQVARSAPAAAAPVAAPAAAPEPIAEAEPAPVANPVNESAAAETADVVKPTAQLAGEAELAERKGDWSYSAPESPEAAESAPEPTAAAEPDPVTSAEAQDAGTPTAPVAATAPQPETPLVRPTTPLAGEADLGSRKGTWRYTPPIAEDGVDYDGDGIIEGIDEGEKPALLDGPRDGGADDLKQIKGIGPKMEKLCNSLGIYHFDQIAAWTDQEIAWVDANLEGFKGRVSRDEWVAQAKVLAEGGQTSFSARVQDGGVY
ncbi:endonuclease [Antarctobacter jejuensis]|uniref:endonuclease n=1 Tax=Antarctobacter jejuensis TaxID=1439938 RepID=UPI003FD5A5AD